MIRYISLLLFIGLAWGQDCTADDGTDGVELWGECYSIENTTQLDLSNSGLTGEMPPEISNLTNLTYLYLRENELTGSIPPEIGNLTNLTHLNLRSNLLTGSIPSEIGNLTNLIGLRLDDNQLTGEIPESICNLVGGYSIIYISNNQLCPPYPSCIEDYVGEQDLCSCGFDDDDMVYLWGNCYSIEYTTEIYLSNSGLTGEIPSEIGNLTNLTYLFLSSNQLTGSIPPEIGNLTNLTFLSLSSNELTGEIPPEIGNLTNLTYLNLHDNQLTGIIPDEICNQGDNSPSLFNNQLCPPYPSCIYVDEQDTSGCD